MKLGAFRGITGGKTHRLAPRRFQVDGIKQLKKETTAIVLCRYDSGMLLPVSKKIAGSNVPHRKRRFENTNLIAIGRKRVKFFLDTTSQNHGAAFGARHGADLDQRGLSRETPFQFARWIQDVQPTVGRSNQRLITPVAIDVGYVKVQRKRITDLVFP